MKTTLAALVLLSASTVPSFAADAKMKPVTTVSGPAADHLIAYIRTFKK